MSHQLQTIGLLTLRPCSSGLGHEWTIVRQYFDAASQAILKEIGLHAVDPSWEDPSDQEPTTPGVVRFDELALLASKPGLERMVAAASAVNLHLSHIGPLTELQRTLLRDLTKGTRVVDIAVERGFSRRGLHRELSDLWSSLGVENRHQGIALAVQNGWLE